MVPPLSDIKASCQSCHPNDLDARAQVYATKLGVQIGAGTAPAAPVASSASPTAGEGTPSASAPPASSAPQSPAAMSESLAIALDDPNVVNYVQRYNEIVLGEKPVNWGNVIMALLSGFILIGGGIFVVHNEKLINISFGDTKPLEKEYPADIVEILPSLTKMKPQKRKLLGKILNNPKKAEKVLELLDEVVSTEEQEE